MRKIALLFIIIVLTATVGAVSAQENETYVVQRGDSIAGIAAAFDVDADAILLANNLIDPSRIFVGQVLTIPTVSLTIPGTHTIGAGETLADIAIRYNTTIEALVDANTIVQPNNLTVGRVLILPATGGPATFARSYRVDIGDTLRNIGARYGVTWQQIAAYNNIPNPNYIQAGMIITIPPADYVVPAQYGTGGPVVQVPVTPRTVINNIYHVRHGDTMLAIANWFGVDVWDLARRNGIYNLNHIYAGQALAIY